MILTFHLLVLFILFGVIAQAAIVTFSSKQSQFSIEFTAPYSNVTFRTTASIAIVCGGIRVITGSDMAGISSTPAIMQCQHYATTPIGFGVNIKESQTPVSNWVPVAVSATYYAPLVPIVSGRINNSDPTLVDVFFDATNFLTDTAYFTSISSSYKFDISSSGPLTLTSAFSVTNQGVKTPLIGYIDQQGTLLTLSKQLPLLSSTLMLTFQHTIAGPLPITVAIIPEDPINVTVPPVILNLNTQRPFPSVQVAKIEQLATKIPPINSVASGEATFTFYVAPEPGLETTLYFDSYANGEYDVYFFHCHSPDTTLNPSSIADQKVSFQTTQDRDYYVLECTASVQPRVYLRAIVALSPIFFLPRTSISPIIPHSISALPYLPSNMPRSARFSRYPEELSIISSQSSFTTMGLSQMLVMPGSEKGFSFFPNASAASSYSIQTDSVTAYYISGDISNPQISQTSLISDCPGPSCPQGFTGYQFSLDPSSLPIVHNVHVPFALESTYKLPTKQGDDFYQVTEQGVSAKFTSNSIGWTSQTIQFSSITSNFSPDKLPVFFDIRFSSSPVVPGSTNSPIRLKLTLEVANTYLYYPTSEQLAGFDTNTLWKITYASSVFLDSYTFFDIKIADFGFNLGEPLWTAPSPTRLVATKRNEFESIVTTEMVSSGVLLTNPWTPLIELFVDVPLNQIPETLSIDVKQYASAGVPSTYNVNIETRNFYGGNLQVFFSSYNLESTIMIPFIDKIDEPYPKMPYLASGMDLWFSFDQIYSTGVLDFTLILPVSSSNIQTISLETFTIDTMTDLLDFITIPDSLPALETGASVSIRVTFTPSTSEVQSGSMDTIPLQILPNCQVSSTELVNLMDPLKCQCKDGFKGLLCGESIYCDELSLKMCVSNHGYIAPLFDDSTKCDESQTCTCYYEWVGSRCETCPLQCGEHGRAQKNCDQCGCYTGYTGDRCNCQGIEAGIVLNAYNPLVEENKGRFLSTLPHNNQNRTNPTLFTTELIGLFPGLTLKSEIDANFFELGKEVFGEFQLPLTGLSTGQFSLSMAPSPTKPLHTIFSFKLVFGCEESNPHLTRVDVVKAQWDKFVEGFLSFEVIQTRFIRPDGEDGDIESSFEPIPGVSPPEEPIEEPEPNSARNYAIGVFIWGFMLIMIC
jgi:hypothetical protein